MDRSAWPTRNSYVKKPKSSGDDAERLLEEARKNGEGTR
jgi:hypothetical protein